MDLKQAREYFELGVITGFHAVRDPMTTGWLLVVEGRESRSWTLQTARGSSRSFSDLSTLVGVIESIAGRVSAFAVRV